ncbi:glycosyltransferase [Candidatus Sumerlaeota bacterium]|nr:glycosyltransferase [Candidatus Sumerlaeota bacterium]
MMTSLDPTSATRPDVSVVIPAFNEAESVGEVVRRIAALNIANEIVVVDDGSTDGTADAAREAGARVVRHSKNRGNGAAVRTGCEAARGEWIVMLDADGQHPAEEIPALLEHCGECDLVVGARAPGANVSRLRSFGNRGLIRFAEFLSQEKIADLTSGFRAVRREPLLEVVHLFPRHYSYPTTVTMAFLKLGREVRYVSLKTIGRRRTGRSGIRPLRDGLRFLHILLRLTMLFNPQRIFTPTGLFLLVVGSVWGVIQIVLRGGVFGSSLALILSGVFVFFFGLLAEQIAQVRLELGQLARRRPPASRPEEDSTR